MKMKMSIQSRIGFQLSAHHKIWNSKEKINLCQNLLFKTKVSRGVLVTICFGKNMISRATFRANMIKYEK